MKRIAAACFMVLVLTILTASIAFAAQCYNGYFDEYYDYGFDQFGYNRCARIFVGPADGVDGSLDGTVWGDTTYANDLLVMKWNAEWDRGNAEGWTDANGYEAYLDNEWNGMFPGGSGSNWHYKIVWYGSCTEGATLPEGGYCIWGQFEVLMDQGMDPNFGPGHMWFAHALPNGYGAY